jgi:hypothetical protein
MNRSNKVLRTTAHWSEAAWEFLFSFLGGSIGLLTSDFKDNVFMIV